MRLIVATLVTSSAARKGTVPVAAPDRNCYFANGNSGQIVECLPDFFVKGNNPIKITKLIRELLLLILLLLLLFVL